MMDTFVSVLLPVRNAATTLPHALHGLLAEPDSAREVVAVDDGSSDATWAVLCEHAQRDPRVRPLRASGTGLVAALQQAACAARGGLLARMDADDLAHPRRLSLQRAHMLSAPRVSALGTCVEAFADAGEPGAGMLRYVAWQNGLLSAHDHARECFVESPLCHPSVMLRRSAYQAVGGYRAFDGPEDYDLFLRLLAHGGALEKLPQTLLRWRHSAGRATFADPRYALDRMRAAKAPHLARAVLAAAKARIVAWGAGTTGRRLLRALEPFGVKAALFIDIDPDKLGRTARDVPIVTRDALDPARDAVIVAVGARGARAIIRAELTARGFREGVDAWFAA